MSLIFPLHIILRFSCRS